MDIALEHIPNREVTVRPSDKPWFNQELKRLIRIRNRAWVRFKCTKSDHHLQLFKRCRNEVVSRNRHFRAVYYAQLQANLISENLSSKKWWQITKSLIGRKTHLTIPPIILNGNVIHKQCEKANIFNNYFAEQCTIPPGNYPDLPPLKLQTNAYIEPLQVTSREVYEVLINLNETKASGPDKLGNRILKMCATSLCDPLCKLFNKSLQVEKFPDSWKKAFVCPVLKKADRQIHTNYRPISLLCNMSKVLECLVFNKLYSYLISNNLLTDRNAGFKKMMVLHTS